MCKAMVLHRRDLAASRHPCGCHTGQRGPLSPAMHGTAPARQPGLGRQQRGVEKSGGERCRAMPGSGLSAHWLLCLERVPTALQHDTAVRALQSRLGSDRMQPALVAEGRAEQKGLPISWHFFVPMAPGPRAQVAPGPGPYCPQKPRVPLAVLGLQAGPFPAVSPGRSVAHAWVSGPCRPLPSSPSSPPCPHLPPPASARKSEPGSKVSFPLGARCLALAPGPRLSSRCLSL